MKNWKTTAAGILMLCGSLSAIWVPPKYLPQINATITAISACGLIAAKDGSNKQ